MKIVLFLFVVTPLLLHPVLANGEMGVNLEDYLLESIETEDEYSDSGQVEDSESDEVEVESDSFEFEPKKDENTRARRQATFQILLNGIGGQNTGLGYGGSGGGIGDWNQGGYYDGWQTGSYPYNWGQTGSSYSPYNWGQTGSSYSPWGQTGSGYNSGWPGNWWQNTWQSGNWGQNSWSPNGGWYDNNNQGGVQIANYGNWQGNLGSNVPYNGGGYWPYPIPIPYPTVVGQQCTSSKERSGKCKGKKKSFF